MYLVGYFYSSSALHMKAQKELYIITDITVQRAKLQIFAIRTLCSDTSAVATCTCFKFIFGCFKIHEPVEIETSKST